MAVFFGSIDHLRYPLWVSLGQRVEVLLGSRLSSSSSWGASPSPREEAPQGWVPVRRTHADHEHPFPS